MFFLKKLKKPHKKNKKNLLKLKNIKMLKKLEIDREKVKTPLIFPISPLKK